MGELIELAPFLQLRSASTIGTGDSRRTPTLALAGRGPSRPLPEARPEARSGQCESCTRRSAAAEVFRSDALAAGLGGRLQCERCLAADLRRGRCGPDAARVQALLARRLRGTDRAIRLRVDWDVRLERAVSLDGILLE